MGPLKQTADCDTTASSRLVSRRQEQLFQGTAHKHLLLAKQTLLSEVSKRGRQKGLARGDPSYARGSDLFSAQLFLCPLRRRGTQFWDLFCAVFWALLGANPLPPTPSRQPLFETSDFGVIVMIFGWAGCEARVIIHLGEPAAILFISRETYRCKHRKALMACFRGVSHKYRRICCRMRCAMCVCVKGRVSHHCGGALASLKCIALKGHPLGRSKFPPPSRHTLIHVTFSMTCFTPRYFS